MTQTARFTHRHVVRFGEIDYAGIVYYPNFFDFFQQVEEEFMDHLGYPYPHLLGELGWGFPIVHAEADFKRPVRYGEVLNIELAVCHLGRSSVTFRFRARGERSQALHAQAEITHVLIDTATFRPMPFPEEMQTRLITYWEGAEPPSAP